MDDARLTNALTPALGKVLATNLVRQFLKLRQDCATGALEQVSAGKFVEHFVQALQQLATGAHDAKPDVDKYLNTHAENATALSEHLRLCAARIARSIYTLRNKRNVAHVGDVDPNRFDLKFCHDAASWIMAEMLRSSAPGLTMEQAGELIALVQSPVGTLVEEIGGVRIVLGDVDMRAEMLLLLHSHYPAAVTLDVLYKSMSRRSAGSVRNKIRDLYQAKLAQGDAKTGYRLTQAGYVAAVAEIMATREKSAA